MTVRINITTRWKYLSNKLIILIYTVFLFFTITDVFCQGSNRIDVSEAEREKAIIAKLDQEITLFEGYLKFITKTEKGDSEINTQINLALNKFDSASTVQVSTLRDTNLIFTYKTFDYLNHLAYLRNKYSDIEIRFKSQSIDKLEKISNNEYRASGFYVQVFRGMDEDGKILYGDKTKKSIFFRVYDVELPDKRIVTRIKILKIDVVSTKELTERD